MPSTVQINVEEKTMGILFQWVWSALIAVGSGLCVARGAFG